MPRFELLKQDKPNAPARWVQESAATLDDIEKRLTSERKALLSARSVDTVRSPLRFARKDKPQFFAELSDAVFMEVPLPETLSEFSESLGTKRSQDVCGKLRGVIIGGESLVAGMLTLPRAFSDAEVGMVEAFGKVGKLPDGLRRCYELMDRADRVRRAAVGAMWYPGIIFLVVLSFIYFIGNGALPKLRAVYTEQKPPPLFDLVCRVADATINNTLFIVGLLVFGLPAAVILFRLAVRSPLAHRLLLRVPKLGGLVKTYVSANFLRTYAALTESEMPEPVKMRMCIGLCPLRPYQEAFAWARVDTQAGAKPHEALERYQALFGKRIMGSLRRGSKSGKMADVLKTALVPIERDLDDAIETFKKLAPTLILLCVLPVVVVLIVGVFSGIVGLLSVY